MMYNVAIIGAGPAGIFAALEIMKLKPEWKVVLIEKDKELKKENVLSVKVLQNVLTAADAVCCAAGAVQVRFLTEN